MMRSLTEEASSSQEHAGVHVHEVFQLRVLLAPREEGVPNREDGRSSIDGYRQWLAVVNMTTGMEDVPRVMREARIKSPKDIAS